jgi:5'-3' exonuclease
MGIKHFFKFFKDRFSDSIYRLKKGETLSDIKEEMIMEEGVLIDNLMIDMNGLFHNSAQKVYQYGNFKVPQRLMGNSRHSKNAGGYQKQLKLFQDVCASIDNILNIVKPRKRLIMCVDGPAPLSKQAQQRQRRFMSALEADENRTFDSCCITPGTKFMDFLSKYIDWHIRKQMSNPECPWSNIEVIFSNEKAPGEGEHKLLSYVRKYGNKDESYCINGMDADLIMLALASHMPKFYILREEMMDPHFDFYLIDICTVRSSLGEIMRWNDTKIKYDIERAINDFIFMCFTVGNDFLPHIPGLEIIEGSIEFMFDVYKNVGEEFGHITRTGSKGIRFCRKALTAFLGTISQYEKGVLENKLSHKDRYFPNPLLEGCARLSEGKYDLDIDEYRKQYYAVNLPEVKDEETLCHDYLEGMQWVLSYYTEGASNWKWRYPHHYAPFAHTIAKYANSFKFPEYTESTPTIPFIQLLSVLPPKSAELLPEPLNFLLKGKEMQEYCPAEFPIDLSGCKNTWEATVILPMVEYSDIEKLYFKYIQKVSEQERKRNILGKSYLYQQSSSYNFHSFYGDFPCSVTTKIIDL